MAGKKAGSVKHYKFDPKAIPEGMVLETVNVSITQRKPDDKLTIETLLPVANGAGVNASVKWLSSLGLDGPKMVAHWIRRGIIESQSRQAGSKNGLKIKAEKIGTILPTVTDHKGIADKKQAAKDWMFQVYERTGTPPTATEISEKFKGLTL